MDNKDCLCPHGYLHPMSTRLVKYIPTTVHNKLKTILKKDWDSKKSYALNINKQNPDLTNLKISYRNIRCNGCTLLLYKYMVEKVNKMKIILELVRKLKKL